MNQRIVYVVLGIFGLVSSWLFIIDFLAGPEPSPGNFLSALFANSAASAASADLLVSALVFLVFMTLEARRAGMKRRWKYIATTLVLGLSAGLPLFLYDRSKALDAGSKASAGGPVASR